MMEEELIDDQLEMDQSAYEMYHQAQTNAPCLSFDIITDDLGKPRVDYPHTCFLVAGTQAETQSQNKLIIMKLSNLKRTYKENEDSNSEDSESEDDEDEKPELEVAAINHNGCVNRVRCTQIEDKRFCASWSEIGKVFIWDLNEPLTAVIDPKAMGDFVKKTKQSLPLYQFAHTTEGFAVDWSQLTLGQLATGDCNGNIHCWKLEESTKSWNVDQRPYIGHKGSVEDIQWSPNEPTVFASCGVDKSIRIWDIRASPLKANMITSENAHTSDVNVINWNRNEPFIASGGDDAFLKIWDLRLFAQNKPVAVLKYHTKPITSIEWNFTDSTVFAAASEDDKLTIWDLAVEKDDNMLDSESEKIKDENLNDIDYPEQLLFVHQGQKEMKELHWHSQIPGLIISTAHTGFNIFKTISV